MRTLLFLFWVAVTGLLVYILNNPVGSIPAMGKLLNPHTGFWQNLEGDKPTLPESVVNTHLSAPVSVVWDQNLIPHISGQNHLDVYFVQGYVTAQMRLWQMDFQTRAAAGRISEVVGDAAIDFDKSMRRKGMLMGAQKNTDALTEEYKPIFDSYTAGINAFINTLDERTLPVEYKLLGMQPEPWSNFKTMLLQEYLVNMLNSFNHDIEYTRFLDQYGYQEWALLYGGLDQQKDPIVNKAGSWGFEAEDKTHTPTDVVNAPPSLKNNHNPDPNNGSNNWAVSPGRTASGHALLANDPHLRLNLPALWFVVHLTAPNLNVMGASLPGAPAVIIGYNNHIAWGYTNAQRDMVDWYKVQFADATKKAIVVDGKREDIIESVQEIKVRGGKTIFDTLYYSSFGIIANYQEKLETTSNTAWAYKWIGQHENPTAISFIKLNQSQSFEDYVEATNFMTAPGQNVVFADNTGNIAIRIQGQYLNRANNEGLFLRDGTTKQNQWDYIPLAQNIISKNPERGFVSSANQHPADSTYPYFIAATHYEVYRNRRINNVLRGDTQVTVQDMMNLHHDNFNMEAAENLAYFLAALDYNALSDEEKRVFELLMNWNYHSNPELEAPVYYDEWRNFILKLAWDELAPEDGHETRFAKPNKHRTFRLLKEQPTLAWWNIANTTETEDAAGLIKYSFKEMMQTINTWQNDEAHAAATLNWGNYKNTHITHLTLQKALSEPVFVGGNLSIVNATSSTHGPSWRQIVEMDPAGTTAWIIYPGGQSGNPGGQFYTNQVKPWAEKGYFKYNLTTPANSYTPAALQTTTFKPE